VARSEPFIPKDAGQQLERLRATAFDPAHQELREWRARLNAQPTNPAVASHFVRLCIDKYRNESDPRYLGRAQAAMAPWWNAPTAPAEILVLRATIKQSLHEFTNALADLDTAIHLDGRNPQAWLTKATILTVLGEYKDARRACLPLAQLAPGLIAVTAAASVTSLNGEAERSCNLLKTALQGSTSASNSEKIWALTVLAETYERLGRNAEAESFFKSAMALAERDPYLLGAYADLLLDMGRPKEVVDLLKNETRADGLLLRLTLAEAAIEPRPALCQAHIAELQARFEAGHLRGDFVHQREEARFQLQLLHNPAEALRLAQANWMAQHEPADVRILHEAAIAARDAQAEQIALNFVHSNHLEDVAVK
jgi:tetratricopeptide (TPR) repeat protein